MPSLRVGYRIALITLAITLTSLIAIGTYYRAHPDEYYHADAFRFFEQHWWPPDLNSSEVIYSPQGWSRVYTGEIVYLAFGKVSRVIQLFWSPENGTFLIYRFSNVGLFLLTLGALFFTHCRWIDIQVLGLVFVCIPQVHYLYAYANSDAFGLSMGVFLFLLAAVMTDRAIKIVVVVAYHLAGGTNRISLRIEEAVSVLANTALRIDWNKALAGSRSGRLGHWATSDHPFGRGTGCRSRDRRAPEVCLSIDAGRFRRGGRSDARGEGCRGVQAKQPDVRDTSAGLKGGRVPRPIA